MSFRYLCRLALGIVFLWAALAKISDIEGFAGQIHNYRMIPVALENIFALVLVWIELVLGLFLVINVMPRSSTLLSGALMGVFLIAIGQAVARNLDIDCGCFGTADASRTGLTAIVRDIVFLALAWLGFPRGEHKSTP